MNPPMLVFDGDCGFCTSSARWIEKRLPDTVEVVPWQFLDDLGALGLTPAEAAAQAWWIDAEGRRHSGPLAIGKARAAPVADWRLLVLLRAVAPCPWPRVHLSR